MRIWDDPFVRVALFCYLALAAVSVLDITERSLEEQLPAVAARPTAGIERTSSLESTIPTRHEENSRQSTFLETRLMAVLLRVSVAVMEKSLGSRMTFQAMKVNAALSGFS
jgi:hypothetical protein